MRPKTYSLLQRCVEDGVAYGYRRAFKHVESPSEEAICERIVTEVMNELAEWFDFEAVEE